MAITIDPTIQEQIKQLKLQGLMRRYIELNYDKIAQNANGLTDAANSIQKQMDQVQTAYDAINAAP